MSNDLSRDLGGNLNNGYSLAPAKTGEVKGLSYLLPYWTPAEVVLVGNEKPVAAPLKYDLFQQELRVRRPQGDSVVVPLARVREFRLLPTTGSVRRFLCFPAAALPAATGDGCGEVLADGAQLQLLKFRRSEVVSRPSQEGSYASNSSMKEYAEVATYYLRWPTDGHFTAVKPKRSSLEQALAGQPAALAALKTRKGSLGSEADLAAAVQALAPTITASH
jgi:hypothetical protein